MVWHRKCFKRLQSLATTLDAATFESKNEHSQGFVSNHGERNRNGERIPSSFARVRAVKSNHEVVSKRMEKKTTDEAASRSTSPPADKNPRVPRGVGEHLPALVSLFRPQAQALVLVPGSPNPVGWKRKTLKIFGPGLVTGAADDDPSGIATYSSVGAQFGYAMLWTTPLIYPFMAAIQEISARMGRVTGRGVAGNIRRF